MGGGTVKRHCIRERDAMHSAVFYFLYLKKNVIG